MFFSIKILYKGKQAAIFANPNGGYDVRVIDETDDALNQDGNLKIIQRKK